MKVFLETIRNLKLLFQKKAYKEYIIDYSSAFGDRLKALEILLQFKIKHPEYYIKALTHRSYIEINENFVESNERLEFLGDAVLGAVTAEYLFKYYIQEDEGFLTKSRAKLVNKTTLSDSANLIKLKELIYFDSRYISANQKGMNTIQADAMEALIGAIYLDAGFQKAEEFIHKWIIIPFINTEKFTSDINYKGQLLEYTHANKLETPVYNLLKEEGPEHQKIFTIEVLINETSWGVGTGKNKKQTEQEAAKEALFKLGVKI